MQSHPTVTAAEAEWRMLEAASDVLFQMNRVKPEYIVSNAHYKPALESVLIVWKCQLLILKGHLQTLFFLITNLHSLRRQSRQN